MSTETYRERFDNLLRVLRGVQSHHTDEEFNLLTWYTDGSLSSYECETSACAVGWCCQDAWFQQQGLTLLKERYYISYPVFSGFKEWYAVREFFGIDESTATFLFSEESYAELEFDFVPVEEVIERIEMFIKDFIPE